ncbi:MAG: 2-oxo acid dehydrogenase subunit E2 [Candidatus Obscuribacterales bacterium]|nr:2-oxo acid dehydrogenase subunit E2 [Candidatus Obscuribacterales bacterium]
MGDEKKNDKSFHFSKLPRLRWNILDMINIVGAGSVPTYFFLDIDMTWAEELRATLAKNGIRVTATAFLLKAIAIAQRAHPDTRTAMLPFGRTVVFNNIVAGFTVERFIGSQPTLFFGAIEEPDTKSIADISEELRAHAEADLENVWHMKLQHRFTWMPWFLRRLILWVGLRNPGVRLKCLGATFGLSSLGKFGLQAMIPPCVSTSTFGVGTIEKRPVVRDGQIEVRKMMTLTLNFDHRIIDGAPAARFMADVQKLLEGGLEKYLQEELHELAARMKESGNPNLAALEAN